MPAEKFGRYTSQCGHERPQHGRSEAMKCPLTCLNVARPIDLTVLSHGPSVLHAPRGSGTPTRRPAPGEPPQTGWDGLVRAQKGRWRPNRPEFDKAGGSGRLEGLPRSGARGSGSGAVGVRFLRTQQRVKSQCLYRLGYFAGSPRATFFGGWWGFL